MKDVSVFVVEEDLTAVGADHQFFGGGRPWDHGHSVRVLFSPFAVALYSSDNDIAVFIGDADLGAIGRPLHVLDEWGFSIVDHLFDPLSLVLHEDYDGACGVAGGKFTIFFIPGDEGDVSGVVGQIGGFVALGVISLGFEGIEFDQFEETFAGSDCEPTLVVIPGAGWGDWVSGNCYLFLEEGEHLNCVLNINVW